MTFIIGTDAVSFVLKGSVHRDAGSFVVKASNIKRQTRNFKTKDWDEIETGIRWGTAKDPKQRGLMY